MDEWALWQDLDVRFDLGAGELELTRGEVLVDALNYVEDTKGNNGDKGRLCITNLRMMWSSTRRPRTNLSIGYSCILNLNIRTAHSRIRGNTQALYVMCRSGRTRFEFIFTHLVPNSPRLFTTVQAVHRSFETTKMYRNLKLRGAIIEDKQLILLPQEQVFNRIPGVWNLSSDQGNLGILYITNIRVTWFAMLAENFNVSIPYLQMRSVMLAKSRFGRAMVIETQPRSGSYALGFRADPAEKMKEVVDEIVRMHTVYSKAPILGVEVHVEEVPPPLAEVKVDRVDDDVQIVADEDDAVAAYYAEGNRDHDLQPEFSPHLGLAMEKLPQGVSVEALWSILPQESV